MVAGKRCRMVGRISMDLMALDVTDLPVSAVRRGQMVTLIGDGLRSTRSPRRPAPFATSC